MNFEERHPWAGPVLIFKPKIFHPNVDDQGHMHWFVRNWTPAYTMDKIIRQTLHMLYEPNDLNLDVLRKNKLDILDKSDKGKEELEKASGVEPIYENPFAHEIWSDKALLMELIMKDITISHH
jgi:ubiquitin-protein ligase